MFSNQEIKHITFIKVNEVSDEYAPKPAYKFIPEWYKKMEPSFPKERTPDALPTIKKCIPVLDAMTAGYILVTPCDVYVQMKDGEPSLQATFDGYISHHPRKQGYKHPSANEYPFPKWINPWAIKTPKGYSTLFIPPVHNPNEWFVALEGVVDTDNYSAPVNFPFVLKNPTREGLIPAGTPMVQAIPFKRDKWESSISEDSKDSKQLLTHLSSHWFDRYKKLFWDKKSYT